jgi:hypothetical protein
MLKNKNNKQRSLFNILNISLETIPTPTPPTPLFVFLSYPLYVFFLKDQHYIVETIKG